MTLGAAFRQAHADPDERRAMFENTTANRKAREDTLDCGLTPAQLKAASEQRRAETRERNPGWFA